MKRNITNIVVLLLVAGLFFMCNYPCMFHKSPEERLQASIDRLRDKLANGDIETRRKIMSRYNWGHYDHRVPEEEIVPVFIEVLRDNSYDVIRAMAAKTLAYYPSQPDVIPALEVGVADADPGVKFACATALVQTTQDIDRLFPVIMNLVPVESIDHDLLEMGLWSLPGHLDRDNWDSLAPVLLAKLDAAPDDQRFNLASMLYGLGIYDERYVPDILARLEINNLALRKSAVGMLGGMGEEGETAIPALLEYWAETIPDQHAHERVTEEIALFGPLLAPHLELIIDADIPRERYLDLLTLVSAIGPEAEPAVPRLVEIFNTEKYIPRANDSSVHHQIINTLGSIGTPAAAEAGVPLVIECCEYLAARGESILAVPLDNLNTFGVIPPEITDIMQPAISECDAESWQSIATTITAAQLSPDDQQSVEKLRSLWPEDPRRDGYIHRLAVALSRSGNADLLMPYLESCFTDVHKKLEYMPVVEVCTNLGPEAGPVVPTIVERLGWRRVYEHPGGTYRVAVSTRTIEVLIYLECLAAIGPAASEALPLLADLREHAKPCDVEYIDEVIAAITPED